MTDAIQVFKPGFRVEDSNGDPVSGAIIYFFDSGTTTPRTVYSDRTLSTSLGTSVTCNSVGIPTSNGTTVCEIYTGNTAYKVQIKDSGGTLIPGFSWDGIIGALDTSVFALTTAAVAPSFLAKSADYTILSTDTEKLIEFDTTGGNVTATLPSAVTVGNTFRVGIRKKVSSNVLTVATASAQTIRHDTTTGITSYTLQGQGEECWLSSDGANWIMYARVGRVVLGPGTATVKPLTFTSGTLNTTAVAGVCEYDGTAFYASAAASSRQVINTEQLVCLSSTYTLTSTTSLQKLFNVPSNGSLTVQGSTTYMFEALFSLSSMSATSGNLLFHVGDAANSGLGTATLTSVAFITQGIDQSTLSTVAALSGAFNATDQSAASVVTAATGTGMHVWVRGVMRVNAGGTLIPGVALVTAAAAVVGANSWFRLWPIGSGSVTSVGNWT